MSLSQIGIDLGGTKTEIAAFIDGAEQFRRRVKTPALSYDAILDMILMLVKECQKNIDVSSSIGIGMPGALTDHGIVKNSNTQCLNGKPFKSDIERVLLQQVRIMNDANCFALSEAVDGAAKGATIVLGVILGTGVGGGVIINNRPLRGCNSIAGEWGHNPLPTTAPRVSDGDRVCYCGRKNCIETYLCGSGLIRTFYEATADNVSAETIARLIDSGDSSAQQVFEIYCQQAAASLATVINVLDPDVVVLGGGLSNFPAIDAAIEKYLPDYVFSDQVLTRVVKNHHGDSSGVRGAAWLWSD